MELTQNELMQSLEELQLPGQTLDRCETLLAQERYREMYLYLRGMRAPFVEKMHESQKRLDLLDLLLFDIGKKGK